MFEPQRQFMVQRSCRPALWKVVALATQGQRRTTAHAGSFEFPSGIRPPFTSSIIRRSSATLGSLHGDFADEAGPGGYRIRTSSDDHIFHTFQNPASAIFHKEELLGPASARARTAGVCDHWLLGDRYHSDERLHILRLIITRATDLQRRE